MEGGGPAGGEPMAGAPDRKRAKTSVREWSSVMPDPDTKDDSPPCGADLLLAGAQLLGGPAHTPTLESPSPAAADAACATPAGEEPVGLDSTTGEEKPVEGRPRLDSRKSSEAGSQDLKIKGILGVDAFVPAEYDSWGQKASERPSQWVYPPPIVCCESPDRRSADEGSQGVVDNKENPRERSTDDPDPNWNLASQEVIEMEK